MMFYINIGKTDHYSLIQNIEGMLIRTLSSLLLFSTILINFLNTPKHLFAQEQGELLWQFVMDDNVESNSPAVVDGIVYITSKTAVFAVDKNTGEEIWSTGLNGNPISDSPQIVDEVLYIADQRRIVYALDIHSGQVIWARDSEETSTLSRARTTVYGKTVFVTTGSDDNNNNGWIRALDTVDGEILWEYQTSRAVSESYPVYKDGIVYAGDFRGYMYALDARSGERVWFFNTSNTYVHSSPTVHNGVVYVAASQVLPHDDSSDVPLYDGYLYALDAYTGDEVWNEPIVDSIGVGGMYSTPTVLDDMLYIGFGTRLKAFDINDRELVWEYETDDFQWIKSSPTIADGVVFFASRDRHIYALDAAEGTERWRLETPYLARSSPVVIDGVVYIGADRFDIDDSGSDFPENVVEGYLYAIASGVNGSSEGSRIDLGVINHHFGMLPFMGVEVVSTNSPVDEGGPVEIEVAVRNTGSETTQTITLKNFDEEVVDQQEVTVGRNETVTITLGWDTATGDASYGDAVISSADDFVSERIVIMRRHTINGCEDITVPGYYFMANSVGVNATCITITSSYVELDGNM